MQIKELKYFWIDFKHLFHAGKTDGEKSKSSSNQQSNPQSSYSNPQS